MIHIPLGNQKLPLHFMTVNIFFSEDSVLTIKQDGLGARLTSISILPQSLTSYMLLNLLVHQFPHLQNGFHSY